MYILYSNQTGDIYRHVRDNQDNRRGYGLPSIKQAQFASKNGDPFGKDWPRRGWVVVGAKVRERNAVRMA